MSRACRSAENESLKDPVDAIVGSVAEAKTSLQPAAADGTPPTPDESGSLTVDGPTVGLIDRNDSPPSNPSQISDFSHSDNRRNTHLQ